LVGYGGADTFAFTTALGGGNVDSVFDFAAGTDKIGLDDAVFTAIGPTLGANAFVVGSAAADADDRIIYNSATGQLFYDADGNGAGAAVQFATLSPGRGAPLFCARQPMSTAGRSGMKAEARPQQAAARPPEGWAGRQFCEGKAPISAMH